MYLLWNELHVHDLTALLQNFVNSTSGWRREMELKIESCIHVQRNLGTPKITQEARELSINMER